jgi:hypothetical protein
VVGRIHGELVAYVGSYDGTFYAFPMAQLAELAHARERSNRDFWLSFPIALAAVAVVAGLLTWRHRRRRAPSAPS